MSVHNFHAFVCRIRRKSEDKISTTHSVWVPKMWKLEQAENLLSMQPRLLEIYTTKQKQKIDFICKEK